MAVILDLPPDLVGLVADFAPEAYVTLCNTSKAMRPFLAHARQLDFYGELPEFMEQSKSLRVLTLKGWIINDCIPPINICEPRIGPLPSGLTTLRVDYLERLTLDFVALLPDGLKTLELPYCFSVEDSPTKLPRSLTTLIAPGVACGNRPAELRAHELSQLTHLSARTVRDSNFLPAGLDKLFLGAIRLVLPLATLPRLKVLSGSIELTDDNVADLPSTLTDLCVNRMHIDLTTAGVAKLCEFPNLTALNICNVVITGPMVWPITLLHLTISNLEGVTVDDIRKLPGLLTFKTCTGGLTNDHIKVLPRCLTTLECNGMYDDECIEDLPTGLTSLNLSNDKITRKCLASLPQGLRTLRLACKITNNDIGRMPAGITDLSVMGDYITEDCVRYIPQTIRTLTIHGSSNKHSMSGFIKGFLKARAGLRSSAAFFGALSRCLSVGRRVACAARCLSVGRRSIWLSACRPPIEFVSTR